MASYLNYTDEELIGLLKQSDEEAFTELFHRYDNRIYYFILKMIKDENAAQEITQEIFIKIWNKREQFDIIKNGNAYILTIAANHTLTHLKKRLNERKMLERLSSLMEEKTGTNTDESLLFHDCEAMVARAVEKLPFQQKRVYHLSSREGLNYQEIAGKLNISPHTVRNHLVEARRFVRLYLQKRGLASFQLFALAGFLMK